MRTFDSGATRDDDVAKYDYDGFLAPEVLERFAAYMHGHRLQRDGSLRASDNWKHGIPIEVYGKSALRHMMDWWKIRKGLTVQDDIETVLCAILFNVMGALFEVLKERRG